MAARPAFDLTADEHKRRLKHSYQHLANFAAGPVHATRPTVAPVPCNCGAFSPIFCTFFRFLTTEAGINLTVPPEPVTRENNHDCTSKLSAVRAAENRGLLQPRPVAVTRQSGHQPITPTEAEYAGAPAHPEEIRARVAFRVGNSVSSFRSGAWRVIGGGQPSCRSGSKVGKHASC
jgi:hypothetical protein